MSTGKYLSLEEARKAKKLGRFAKEHTSEGDANKFEHLLNKMAKGKKAEKKPAN